MAVFHYQIKLNTYGDGNIKDITPDIEKNLASSGLTDGIISVFVTGSTAGITTIENEPGLIKDFHKLWERITPRDIEYAHNDRWGDGNGYAHMRASLLGASLTVPFRGRKMLLGTWQQIVLVEFDNRARQREIAVQVMGE